MRKNLRNSKLIFWDLDLNPSLGLSPRLSLIPSLLVIILIIKIMMKIPT